MKNPTPPPQFEFNHRGFRKSCLALQAVGGDPCWGPRPRWDGDANCVKVKVLELIWVDSCSWVKYTNRLLRLSKPLLNFHSEGRKPVLGLHNFEQLVAQDETLWDDTKMEYVWSKQESNSTEHTWIKVLTLSINEHTDWKSEPETEFKLFYLRWDGAAISLIPQNPK